MTWQRCSRLGNQNLGSASEIKVIKTVSFQAFNEAGVISMLLLISRSVVWNFQTNLPPIYKFTTFFVAVTGSEQKIPGVHQYECRWNKILQHNSRRPCKLAFKLNLKKITTLTHLIFTTLYQTVRIVKSCFSSVKMVVMFYSRGAPKKIPQCISSPLFANH
jgi:hypothetical protein